MSTSPRAVIELAERAFIGEAGLIRAIREMLISAGEPRVHCAVSIIAALDRVSNVRVAGDQGAVGFTWDEAAVGAIGETIERYCGAYYEWDDLIYASAEELGPEAVGMDRFALHTDDIYAHPMAAPFVRWSPDKRCYWVPGRSLTTGRNAYLPAAMVYVPYTVRNSADSDFFGLSVSSGQACHTDPDEALLLGLCEVVERDAFMIGWMRSISPVRIDYRSDPELRRIHRDHFETPNLKFDVFDITLDIRIPTALCVASGTSEAGPFLTVGASTRPSLRDAAVKAMKEATQGAFWARELMVMREGWRPTEDFSNIVTFEDHVRLFCEPDMVPHLDFISNTPQTAGVTDVDPERTSLAAAVEEIRRNDLEVFAVDLTTPEMAELGFHVPKVLVPGLAPLTSVHVLPALASPRYVTVPAKLGLTAPQHQRFNPIPHPFP